MSLTAAVVIIANSARQVSEVKNFPLLIVAVALLQVALSAMSAKAVFSKADAGTVAGFCGGLFGQDNCGLAIPIFGIGATAMFAYICKTIRNIRQRGVEFAADIVPLKEVNIRGQLEAGFVSEEQAQGMHERTSLESRFFTAMAGLGGFLIFGAIIELFAVIINILGGVATGTVSAAMLGASATLGVYQDLQNSAPEIRAVSTASVGIITQMCSLVTMLAVRHLVRRRSLACLDDLECTIRTAKRIEVITKDTRRRNETEPRDQDASIARDIFSASSKRFLSRLPTPRRQVDAELSAVRDSPAAAERRPGGSGEVTNWAGASMSEDAEVFWCEPEGGYEVYYDLITSVIENEATRRLGKTTSILMGSESVGNLPVTLPVNIAVRLAKKGKRTLLVDLDPERDAIEKVFEANETRPESSSTKFGMATCIRGLWICPARVICGKTGKAEGAGLQTLLSAAQQRYEYVIFYAPTIADGASGEQVATCTQSAMLFAGAGNARSSRLEGFYEYLARCRCTILKPETVCAESS
jgi:hypothetical protein